MFHTRILLHQQVNMGLLEPSEFARFINFASWKSPWPETVVSSNQKNQFVTPDDPYVPGFRFYFDAHAIIESELDVRTGSPVFRVQDCLSLASYLVACIQPDQVALEHGLHWTPRTYTHAANEIFKKNLDG